MNLEYFALFIIIFFTSCGISTSLENRSDRKNLLEQDTYEVKIQRELKKQFPNSSSITDHLVYHDSPSRWITEVYTSVPFGVEDQRITQLDSLSLKLAANLGDSLLMIFNYYFPMHYDSADKGSDRQFLEEFDILDEDIIHYRIDILMTENGYNIQSKQLFNN